MGKFTIRNFLHEQWTTIPIPNADISDKSIVVTGANVGLGFEAAIHLAKLKPKRLLLTTRDEAKGEQAKHGTTIGSLICTDSGFDADIEQRSMIKDVEAWPLEMGSFDSVRKFADRFDLEGSSINALIANAAVATLTYTRTQDGWETTFVPNNHLVQCFYADSLFTVRLQVNYLSTALLSILMLPHLIKSTTPTNVSRLVIVSSDAHFQVDKSKLKGATNWPSILGKLNDKGYCTAS